MKPVGDGTYLTYTPDAKDPISGVLEEHEENLSQTHIDVPKSVNLHIDCLSGSEPIEEGVMLTMSAHIALRVHNDRGGNDTWSVAYSSDFIHTPAGIHGLGASTDGETFSGDCYATGGDSWQSLVIMDTPYDSVWWYVKAPGDTSGLGTQVETDQGDGVERHATMTYTFPEDVGEPLAEGAYYEITAYVYRWDLTVYWDSYQVWVRDKNSDSLTL